MVLPANLTMTWTGPATGSRATGRVLFRMAGWRDKNAGQRVIPVIPLSNIWCEPLSTPCKFLLKGFSRPLLSPVSSSVQSTKPASEPHHHHSSYLLSNLHLLPSPSLEHRHPLRPSDLLEKSLLFVAFCFLVDTPTHTHAHTHAQPHTSWSVHTIRPEAVVEARCRHTTHTARSNTMSNLADMLLQSESKVISNTATLQKYMDLDQRGVIQAEYVWIDGTNGVRSKTKVRDSPPPARSPPVSNRTNAPDSRTFSGGPLQSPTTVRLT